MVYIDALRDRFSGALLTPGHAGYDDARTVFNAMIDRRPTLIASCANTADVAEAVTFAREHGLLTAVRCGGHSVAGLGTCDNGIVIDLGMHGMKQPGSRRKLRGLTRPERVREASRRRLMSW